MALWDHGRNDETNSAWPRHAASPQFSNDNERYSFDNGPADELDCVQQVLAPELLHAAEARGRELGIGADQALIQSGVIDEETYLRRLALHLEIEHEDFSKIGRSDCPLADDQLAFAAASGILPIRQDGRLVWSLAPQRLTARALCRLVVRYPETKPHLRLMSAASLQQFLTYRTGDALGRFAADGLRKRWPQMSAAPDVVEGPTWRRLLRRIRGPCGIAALMVLPPMIALDTWSGVLALWFMAFIGLRFAGSFAPRPARPKLARLSDWQLPVYTIIVALYREARSIAPLLHALDALDYPPEKLQIILAIEPDDLPTRAAIARLGPMPHVQVQIAATTGPKTKPKALNCALPFARGSFVAVYDAEDRPDPGQLRAALDAFRAGGSDLACAQASLTIDNISDSLFSRMFAAEYAGQFDIFLPGLATMHMPLPLGGSSNHFRTSILREVGGWDAWNVTEDADLGFRLARFGYRSVTFDSATREEAPIRFKAWLHQRSRWMKGWMQTWGVHMRNPRQFWRDAGPRGFFALNAIVGGNVLTALAYPILAGEVATYLIAEGAGGSAGWFFTGSLAPLHIATVAAGILSTVVIGLMGLARRGHLRSGGVLALAPLYWGCLSIAAWRALFQLWNDPYRWEKTEHGLAKRPDSITASAQSATVTRKARRQR